MTKQSYGLNVSKIKTLKDVKNVLDNLHLIGYYDADDPNDENYYLSEYFTIPQERQGLTFPAPRRSIEEISQELEEKIDVLIKRTKEKFEYSKEVAEKRYKYEFDRIFERFEYAKDKGHFPHKLTLTIGDGLSVNASSYIQNSFVIKQGNKHEGYYTFGNRRYFKYYMPDKPNMIVRFFMKTCLGVVWIDEKNS